MLIASIIILFVLYVIGRILYNDHPENHRIKYEDNKYIVYLDKDYTELKYNNNEERSINGRLIINSKRNHRDYPLLINVTYNKKDQTYNINYDVIESNFIDITIIKNYLRNNNEFSNALFRKGELS